MCDQVSSSSTVEEVESNSNSDWDLGPLSPGSQRWFAHTLSELLEHHIPPNLASTPCHELNDFDISTSYPPVSFPEFHDDRRILDSQGPLSPSRCFSQGSHSSSLELFEHHIPTIPASTRRQLFDFVEGPLSAAFVDGAELAYSLRNLMNSTAQYSLSQAFSPRMSNHNDQSFVACDYENKLFLAQATDCRENNCQFQSFIPCGSSSELSPCRMASIVYFLYLFEELHQDFRVLGSIFDIRTSFCTPSSKFSYQSSPGNAHGYHYHGTLSLSLLVSSKKSPLGFFEIVYCPLKACFPSKDQGGPGPNKQKQSSSSPYLDSKVVRSSADQDRQRMSLHLLQPHGHSTNASHESPEVIVETHTNNQKRRNKSSTPWSAAGSITKEDLVQRFGMKLEEAARSLSVSVSTFKRLCRVHGISRWPSAKKTRENVSVSQPPNTLLSGIHHKEGNPSLNPNMSGNRETTNENEMTQGRASAKQEQSYRSQLCSDSLSFENPTPNSLARTPQPPENGIICEASAISAGQNQRNGEMAEKLLTENASDVISSFTQKPKDLALPLPSANQVLTKNQALNANARSLNRRNGDDRETSVSGHKRRLEREADSMDEVSHFNEHPSEILNLASERQAVDSATKESSCITSISGTIEGIEVGYNPTLESISEKQSYSSSYLDSTVVPHSSNGPHESSLNAGHESPGVVHTWTNNQKTVNKSSSPWTVPGSINLENVVQCFGMKREVAAETLGVSVSTFKRVCRRHGIVRWPVTKMMRKNASVSQSPNALVSALQHKNANLSLNQNMPGNGETTNVITQGRASAMQELTYKSRQYNQRTDTLSFGNPTPNALARMPQPPENLMMCEEDRETSISGQKRGLERDEDNMDEMSHFYERPSEILNYAPERQAADSAREESSCFTSISGTVEDIEVGHNPIPESVSGHAVNELDPSCVGVKLSLGSTSTQSLNSISSSENTTQNTKLLFSNLIVLPLEDLINPENEASMKKVLSILANNLSVFSEEQAGQILELKFDFPILVHSWREFSRSQMYSQKFFADLEKIRDLVGTSVKDEESLKVRYRELENKEKELVAQLDSVRKEKAGITEQIHEKAKQTKHLVSLAAEKDARTKEMGIAAARLNSLVDQWSKIQALFI